MYTKPYTPRELEIIDKQILPAILGQPSHVPARSDRLHVGFEQLALFNSILSSIKPQVSLEVGTYEGETFALMSRFSGRTISIDPNPAVKSRLAPTFANAQFEVSTSDEALPRLIDEFNNAKTALEFVFIDGNHSTDFVRRDINNVLRYIPQTRTVILMHDSFNPACREGIRSANWKDCPYCHYVELDAVPGLVHPDAACRGQMWGGVAMAMLLPTRRTETLEIRQTHYLTFAAALAGAENRHRSIVGRLSGLLSKLFKPAG